jgi:hypothetical protein
MAEFERIEVGRHVLGPGDMLLIRVRPGITREQVQQFKDQIEAEADGRLKGRVMIIGAEQFVIVRRNEQVTHVA